MLDDHDDHRRINHLLLEALRGVEITAEVWAYQIYSTLVPNVVVDISEQVSEKRALMEMWKFAKGDRDWPHYILGLNATNCRYIPGKGEIYGEAYFVVPLAEYLSLCELYFSNSPNELYSGVNYTGSGS